LPHRRDAAYNAYADKPQREILAQATRAKRCPRTQKLTEEKAA
jgi:hypothetical protein